MARAKRLAEATETPRSCSSLVNTDPGHLDRFRQNAVRECLERRRHVRIGGSDPLGNRNQDSQPRPRSNASTIAPATDHCKRRCLQRLWPAADERSQVQALVLDQPASFEFAHRMMQSSMSPERVAARRPSGG